MFTCGSAPSPGALWDFRREWQGGSRKGFTENVKAQGNDSLQKAAHGKEAGDGVLVCKLYEVCRFRGS